MSSKRANDYQIAGNHYQTSIQHWDFVVANGLDYFQAAITKYVVRWRQKGGIEDLKKAQHYLAKYIELIEAKAKFTVLTPHGISEVESRSRSEKETGDTSLVHWADQHNGDVALCGADYANIRTTDDIHCVTCPGCLS
jgi:Protein of unknwon function (DUF3310)